MMKKKPVPLPPGRSAALLLLLTSCLSGAAEENPLPAGWIRIPEPPLRGGLLTFPGAWSNFRLRLEIRMPPAAPPATLILGEDTAVPLPAFAGKEDDNFNTVEIIHEHSGGETAKLTVNTKRGKQSEPVLLPAARVALKRFTSPVERAADRTAVSLTGDFTLAVRFRTDAWGALAAVLPPDEVWAPDAKSLFIRDGRLAWDIGWQDCMEGRTTVNDGAWHTAVLTSSGGRTAFWVDGLAEGSSRLSRPALAEQIFVIGRGFGGHFAGEIAWVRQWRRALSTAEHQPLFATEEGAGANTPDVEWRTPAAAVRPVMEPVNPAPAVLPFYLPPPSGVPTTLALRAPEGTVIRNVRMQPLDRTPHARLIAAWDDAALQRGAGIYNALCITCHGGPAQEGSMPTARRFHKEPIKNGANPWQLFETLTHGYNQMMPLPQYSAREKYDVIHYLRETFFRTDNPSQYTAIDSAWLDSLPLPLSGAEERSARETAAAEAKLPPYETMDFGPFLFSTYQLAPDVFAFKGLAVALDASAGGVTKSGAWMIYDHDTMCAAAAFTAPGFVDWRGVAWDGSHGTHLSMTGKPVWVSPEGPGWAAPGSENRTDPRFLAADGHRYGPLPQDWVRFSGVRRGAGVPVISWTVGGVPVEEQPGMIAYGANPVITRTLSIGPITQNLTMRLAPVQDGLRVRLRGPESLRLEVAGGFYILRFPPRAEPLRCRVYLSKSDAATLEALVAGDRETPLDFSPAPAVSVSAAAPQPKEIITSEIRRAADTGPLAADVLTIPDRTPSRSWMRLTGIDFLPDGDTAAVCTWSGEVWTVRGIRQDEGTLTWRRIASGLFQPLGLKFTNGKLYICCRDQIVRLQDDDGDGITDRYENFNNDHQVTAHFHEFAMDLQTDAAGNFYYAKGARHGLTGLVPQHGTLLRVSPDGLKTDILATGFRAPNGVCVNDDGTFYLTDQEGFWLPKNRINLVKPGGFYGNVWSGAAPHDPADSAMEQPVAWITNAVDRSPAEIVHVPSGVWGGMGGGLLNLSYGTGKIYSVLTETVNGRMQGGVCPLPLPAAPTGLMRGRFHPDGGGSFFVCGMTGWASNQTADGGLHRLRRTGVPLNMPVGLKARPGRLILTFSDALDAASVREATAFTLTRWDLLRSANYGSEHLNERLLTVKESVLSPDGRTVTLTIPELAPAAGLLLECSLRDAAGGPVKRTIQHTIHRIPADEE